MHACDVYRRRREREKKKKIEADSSSEWLARKIISRCGNWLSDTEPPGAGPHFNLPWRTSGSESRVGTFSVCVCELEEIDLFMLWALRGVKSCRKEWQLLSNYCCPLWLLSSQRLSAPVSEFVKFEWVTFVCVCLWEPRVCVEASYLQPRLSNWSFTQK